MALNHRLILLGDVAPKTAELGSSWLRVANIGLKREVNLLIFSFAFESWRDGSDKRTMLEIWLPVWPALTQNLWPTRVCGETGIGISHLNHLFLLPAPTPNPVPITLLYNFYILRETGGKTSEAGSVLLICLPSWAKSSDQGADLPTFEHPSCY